jgi:hypothetical protein
MDEQNHTSKSVKTDKKQQQMRPPSRERFEQLLQFREKLILETNGLLFEDSVEILRQEREKRTEHLMQVATGQYGKDPYAENTPEEQPKNGI